jgi:NDP-sugar pyrophosphorylase family protein
MRAVILAGGRGTRLKPLTTVIPKPLLPVGDTPILEIIIRQLAAAGFTHVTLTLGYMREYFQFFVQHHSALQELIKIDYVEEETPTGTAGSVTLVKGLDEPFLVMNGDVLTNLDYQKLMQFHSDRGGLLTIAAHRKQIPIELGVLEASPDCRLTSYIEKPTLNYLVSMGIYVYEPEVLSMIAPGKHLDLPALARDLIRRQKRVNVFETHSTWMDLGRPEDLQSATECFLATPDLFVPETRTAGTRVPTRVD